MQLKTLHLTSDLYENVRYDEHAIPLVTCIDDFDEYVNRQWPVHWHEGFELTTPLQGKCQYVVRNKFFEKKITLHEGDGIFINTGVLHSVKALGPQTRVACFVLPPTFFNFQSFEILRRNSIMPVLNSEISELVWQKQNDQDLKITSSIAELCQLSELEIDYELHSVELICRIWRLMVTQLRQHAPEHSNIISNSQINRVRAAIQFIHENYQRQRVTVNDIASAINISRAECFRSFKSIVKQSPIDYLNEYRISMAEMLLTTTDRTVKDISQMCGFSTPSYFIREFKKRYGLTPKKYRQTRN